MTALSFIITIIVLIALLVLVAFIPSDTKSDITAFDREGYREFGKQENYTGDK